MTSPTLDPRRLLLLALAAAPLAVACTGADLGAAETDEQTGATGIFIDPSSSSEGGEQSPELPAQCALEAFTCPHVLRTPVMLVLDNSYSMRAARVGVWDHDGDDADDDGLVDGDPAQLATPRVTRWRSLHGELEMMSAWFGDRLEIGATLFPAFDRTAGADAPLCSVSATPEMSCARTSRRASRARLACWGTTTGSVAR